MLCFAGPYYLVKGLMPEATVVIDQRQTQTRMLGPRAEE